MDRNKKLKPRKLKPGEMLEQGPVSKIRGITTLINPKALAKIKLPKNWGKVKVGKCLVQF